MDTIAIPQPSMQAISIELAKQRRAQENIELIVNTLGHALSVPTGWQFSLESGAFIPPAGAQVVEMTQDELNSAIAAAQEGDNGPKN